MSYDSAIMIAKTAPTSMTKAEWYAEILKRSEQQRPVGESQAIAFTRFIEKSDAGQILYQAYRLASGADWQPPERITKAEMPRQTAGMVGLEKLANEFRTKNQQFTKEQAFDHVATKTVEGRELFSVAKAEHLASMA